MLDLILDVAEKDERIRAVYMTGSRTNPNAPKDMFQDYDIVYVVTETSSFISDENWIDVFGNRIMIQKPDVDCQLKLTPFLKFSRLKLTPEPKLKIKVYS